MTATATIQTVQTNNTNQFAAINTSKPSGTMWMGVEIRNITIHITQEQFLMKVGSSSDLSIAALRNRSTLVLLKGDDSEPDTTIAIGSEGAIKFFMGVNRSALARRDQLAESNPDSAIDILLAEYEQAAKHHTTSKKNSGQKPQESNFTIYCCNPDADFTGAHVVESDSNPDLAQVVIADGKVYAEGENELCTAYLALISEIHSFQNAKHEFESNPHNSNKGLYRSKNCREHAKAILRLTSPKGDTPELVCFRREIPIVAEAVELAKAVLAFGQQMREQAHSDADALISEVELAVYQQGSNYSQMRGLQQMIRDATDIVNTNKFTDLSERIAKVITQKPAVAAKPQLKVAA